MEKLKKVVISMVMMAAMIISFGGYSIKAEAATDNSNYIPKGWTSLGWGDSTGLPNDLLDNKTVLRAPAPGLTSLQIIDLAVDEKNEIHIVTKEIGTSRAGTSLVWNNGSQCTENYNEMQMLTGSDRIVYGYIKYFHTGVKYSSDVSGRTFDVRAQATNAMNPWNTLSASKRFVLP